MHICTKSSEKYKHYQQKEKGEILECVTSYLVMERFTLIILDQLHHLK